MAYDNNEKKESVYSKRIRAGKRRTYFFDVRETRGSDYYVTITESRKRFDDNGYDRHKIFLYKEDFNKFIKALGETIDFVKTDLMPDFDFDAFNHEYNDAEVGAVEQTTENTTEATAPVNNVIASAPVEHEAVQLPTAIAEEEVVAVDNLSKEEVDKW